MSQHFVGHTSIAELEVYSKSNYSALLSKFSTLSDLSLLIQSTPTAKVSNAEEKAAGCGTPPTPCNAAEPL
jgi:hypothetical protein